MAAKFVVNLHELSNDGTRGYSNHTKLLSHSYVPFQFTMTGRLVAVLYVQCRYAMQYAQYVRTEEMYVPIL